jgi:hypothetical protein
MSDAAPDGTRALQLTAKKRLATKEPKRKPVSLAGPLSAIFAAG